METYSLIHWFILIMTILSDIFKKIVERKMANLYARHKGLLKSSYFLNK